MLDLVVMQHLDASRVQKTIDLTQLGPDFYSPKRLDAGSQEITLWKRDHLVTIGFDGAVRKEFRRPAVAQIQQNTYIEMGEFWLAWDAVRENGRYVVEWSLPSGSGLHRIPLGRSIHSAAVDRAGKWIAVSVGSYLNVGRARDAIYVLSAADGHEVLHKYLPRFSRSPVAFLDGGFLVYSDLTGVQVLQVPK